MWTTIYRQTENMCLLLFVSHDIPACNAIAIVARGFCVTVQHFLGEFLCFKCLLRSSFDPIVYSVGIFAFREHTLAHITKVRVLQSVVFCKTGNSRITNVPSNLIYFLILRSVFVSLLFIYFSFVGCLAYIFFCYYLYFGVSPTAATTLSTAIVLLFGLFGLLTFIYAMWCTKCSQWPTGAMKCYFNCCNGLRKIFIMLLTFRSEFLWWPYLRFNSLDITLHTHSNV